jgi:hypothetical protein
MMKRRSEDYHDGSHRSHRIAHLLQFGEVPYRDDELARRALLLRPYLERAAREASALGVDLSDPGCDGPAEGERVAQDNSELVGDKERPCCEQWRLDVDWSLIQGAYINKVYSTDSWLGCQRWASAIAAAVAPYLGKCWRGRFIWRANVYPWGRFGLIDSPSIFVHHAFAVCPCTRKRFRGKGCKVLDPYSVTGLKYFQSPDIYDLSEWTADATDGKVWKVSKKLVQKQETIYIAIARYYNAHSLGVRCSVMAVIYDEWRRFLGAPPATFQFMWRRSELRRIAKRWGCPPGDW